MSHFSLTRSYSTCSRVRRRMMGQQVKSRMEIFKGVKMGEVSKGAKIVDRREVCSLGLSEEVF